MNHRLPRLGVLDETDLSQSQLKFPAFDRHDNLQVEFSFCLIGMKSCNSSLIKSNLPHANNGPQKEASSWATLDQ